MNDRSPGALRASHAHAGALQGTRCDRRNRHLCNLTNRRACSRLCLVWLAVAVAACSSCGTPKPPATVEGTLRHNGVPLDNCLIGFFPEQGSSGKWGHAAGLTDQQGRFRLHNSQQQEGLDVGTHRVTIQDMSVSTGVQRRDHGTVDQGELEERARTAVRHSRVPLEYSSLAGTSLKKEVRPGHQVIDLELP
ncbi:MAG: hypothetical protein FJ276_34355 [Planctomycetes bacterium]|nr:hypothetical protein [Planctomycetota bacterium]